MKNRIIRKVVLNLVHSVNFAALIAEVLGSLPHKPWVMVLQAILAALLPSFAGAGHRAIFGTDQATGEALRK